MLAKDQTTFPDSPSVWLKDIASVLNLRLDMVPENDPLFEGKPKGKFLVEKIWFSMENW